jgi:hypothetical protein
MKPLQHTFKTDETFGTYSTIATCATSDLLLKHLDATLVTYKRRHMKHLRYASETLATYM